MQFYLQSVKDKFYIKNENQLKQKEELEKLGFKFELREYSTSNTSIKYYLMTTNNIIINIDTLEDLLNLNKIFNDCLIIDNNTIIIYNGNLE